LPGARNKAFRPGTSIAVTRGVRALIGLLFVASMVACSEGEAGRPAVTDAAQPVSSSSDESPKPPESESGCVDAWQEVDDGVRYRTAGCREGDGFQLHVVELDPKRWTIDVVDGARRPISDAVASAGARFAINANFFDVNDRSLGVVVTSGRQVRPAHPVSWQSIFSIGRDGRARITSRDEWTRDRPDGVFAAAQAGPRLVVKGRKNQVSKAKPSLRSGVCITKERRVRFFVTPQDNWMDVHEVVGLAARSESDGGMGCFDAMLFDGGPSAQMFLDARDRKISIDGDNVTSYVVAKPRR
jgi:hypothetical protein